ncbi:MAG: 3-hydroxyacyl-CoA dehydrogenase/enoyl-CoA hydratase family protein, partial [Acidimicrobiia bacterium]|nr:3-hydroxyacyl-CoA dehydrogenase/enoyl-CoA hydratase family protein [Acidimicrobiia bacterium]
MGIRIKRVAVLGAGVMGQGIAAHLANAGIPSYLFDIAPGELTADEQKKGLTLESRAVRNRIADAGVAAMIKASPALLYRADLAPLVKACNYADDMALLGECDWIVEVVVERLDIKQRVFTDVEKYRKPGSIVSSNTSGLSVAAMAEGRSEDFRRHFMVTHFFNPVRYMRLLELIPCADTDPGLFAEMAAFGEKVLGKGIVYGKDTPNFVANRIGVFGIVSTVHWMKELGIGVSETDKVFGPTMGRPSSAVFRTADIVGLDTMVHVIGTIAEGCPNDPWRDRFAVPEFLRQMVAKGLLGAKTGAGFFKKVKGEGGSKIQAIDLETLEYGDQPDGRLAAIGAARKQEAVGDKIREMVWFDDQYGRLAWKVTVEISTYAAQLLGEIADDIVNIDRALRWGFNYELGPFETWDAIGVERSVQRMRDEGMAIPPAVETLLAKGEGTWYVKRNGVQHYWDAAAAAYKPVPTDPRLIYLPFLAESKKVISRNEGAVLYDMGDGVGCVEFRTKMNSIDAQIIGMLDEACERVNNGELAGLVVGNEAPNFSVGANVGLVAMLAMNKDWAGIEAAVKGIQDAHMKMKYCTGPVVVAPRGMALGGGCECVMHGTAVRAAAESYMGLVELGVGLIPAGGGCKELALRHYGSIPHGVKADLFPFMEKLFTTIGMAKVSTSAEEARQYGFLKPTDRLSLNPEALLADAKADVLALTSTGYRPPLSRPIPVPGSGGIAALRIAIHTMKMGGFLTEYDQFLGHKLAYIICGGEVPAGTELSEQQMLDLEREAFVSLCGEQRTMDRIMHMLEKGKPL